jgi:hypothetical protein
LGCIKSNKPCDVARNSQERRVGGIKLKQPEDRLNDHPCGYIATGGIVRGRKFLATDGLDRALVESIADATYDADLRGFAIHADQHAQGHSTLHFYVTRFVGVDG